MMTNDGSRLKLQELQDSMQVLWNTVAEAAGTGREAHEIEQDLFRGVLALGRQLLRAFFDMVGPGDRGETIDLPHGGRVRRMEHVISRTYQSVFGDFEIDRWVYASRAGQKIQLVPTDQRLGLPKSEFSYLLQDWAQVLGVEHAWQQVAHMLKRMLGVEQWVDSLERMSRQMAESAEDFRDQLPPPEPAEEGGILVVTVDNKGVPMRRPSDAPPPGARRKKGHKANKKRHATLGGVYSVDPKFRTPEELVAILFHDQPRRTTAIDPAAQQKRFRAALSDPDRDLHGQQETFRWLAEEVERRHQPDQPLVYLTDGQRSLQTDRAKYLDIPGLVEILELMHVVPRIWEAAYLFHAEGSAAAEHFVRPRLLRILQGRAAGVIKGLRRMGSAHRLPPAKRKILETICRFLEQNLSRMRYDEYLAAGFPIASGVIEGACRYVIKDRMERSGMRWTVVGAQAMLDLRIMWVNGCWQEFQKFRIAREHQRLYPCRKHFQRIPWQLAA